jgi:hypothetical protein
MERRKNFLRRGWVVVLSWILASFLFACSSGQGGEFEKQVFVTGTFEEESWDGVAQETQFSTEGLTEKESEEPQSQPEETGIYTDKEQVAFYLHLYGRLPSNYISKKEAERLGWDSREGNLDEVAPGKSIGGGRFGNREGLLPEKKGRIYYECDIDYDGGYRGGKRIVYSNDGLIYYTEDHYNSFELLYTSEGKAE